LELISKTEKYLKDKKQLVITYCNYGNRSGQAAQILREKGYKAFVLEKGIEGYFSEKKNNNVIIGRHLSVSSPEFLVGAVKEAIIYGANALALYVGSPLTRHRSHVSELKPDEFKEFLKKNQTIDIKNIVVHAPYVMNLGNTLEPEIFQKSVKLLRIDIERMITLGLETIVLHPGSSRLGASRSESISQIACGINQVLTDNPPVRIALETMSGEKNKIGSSFKEMREIIQQIERKEKVGVC
jgi:deoxyribonuclease-4